LVNYLRAFYYLQSLRRRVYWSEERVAKYQNKQLRRIVEYAYQNVPAYHKKWREAGIRPGNVRTVADLKKIPIVKKSEIRGNADGFISREYDRSELKMRRTSGSTGQPLYFYINGAEDEYRKAKHLRANIVCGQRQRDRWVVITSPQYFGETTRLQRALNLYATTPVSVFDDVDKQISIIKKFKPDILDGYASSLLLLARSVDTIHDANEIKPRLLISGADLIDSYSRRYVEEVFKAPFYDQYGCAELGELAWQCEERSGYHVDADTVVMQLLNDKAEEVSPGETGEVVCTSLFNYAMPLIRYAVGDLAKASKKEKCPCGRNFELVRIIEGRKDSIVALPDGRAIS
jgi:phenylacetate-CoA ligase